MPESTVTSNRQGIITAIKAENACVIRRLFYQFSPEFSHWAQYRYRVPAIDAEEAYQEAFEVVYLNIREGKLSELKSSFKTYLFAVGKNILKTKIRNRESIPFTPIEEASLDTLDPQILQQYDKQDTCQRVREMLNNIGEPCKTVLELFFMKNYSIEAIAQHMGYANANVAKKRKCLCLKQLRALLPEHETRVA